MAAGVGADLDPTADLEARLIEQEHRSVRVWWNAIHAFLYRDRSDPRHAAAIKALTWHVLSRAPVAAAVGGLAVSTLLIGLLGVLVAVGANRLLQIQNAKIDVQNHLAEAQRRSSLMFELTSILDQLAELKASGDGFVAPDPVLEGRIRALSASLRPYQYLAVRGVTDPVADPPDPSTPTTGGVLARLWGFVWPDDSGPVLMNRALSPERGQLLVTLVSARVRVDYSTIDLSGADAPRAQLVDSSIEGAILVGSNLRGADLTNAKLNMVNLEAADLREADLSGVQIHGGREGHLEAGAICDFTGALLGKAKFVGAEISRVSRDELATGLSGPRKTLMQSGVRYVADFAGADLSGVDFRGANLHGAILSQEQLDRACVDDATILPDGLHAPPPCPQ